jgi:hypothetical protein
VLTAPAGRATSPDLSEIPIVDNPWHQMAHGSAAERDAVGWQRHRLASRRRARCLPQNSMSIGAVTSK